MGTLRTIFAMAVVFAHAGVYMFVGALNGVQLFYMISGFLISFILTEVKAYPEVKDFYANRFLRIYPVYAAVAVLTLGAYFLGIHVYDEFFSVYREAPWSATILLIFSNTFLFLQDWVMFFAVVDGRLIPTGNFMESSPLLYPGLLVPQAWTLGVELTFYLIAPFVLPRRRLVYVLLAASLTLRAIFIARGFGQSDPWSYRFFPTELALFLAGALSHQILLPLYRKTRILRSRAACLTATGLLVTVALTYHLFALPKLTHNIVLFAFFLVLMPFAFIFQRSSALDNWIGELSFPMYICHKLVIAISTRWTDGLKQDQPYTFAWLCVFLSALFAIALNRLVASPMELVRNRFRKKIEISTVPKSPIDRSQGPVSVTAAL
ncbi:acyltransferase [Variovorax sp. J22P271]|nr:acyltransferase [Variovorax sp. J22P271]MDM0037178.1 acyltransferase [Variovorax sp. J22P271]